MLCIKLSSISQVVSKFSFYEHIFVEWLESEIVWSPDGEFIVMGWHEGSLYEINFTYVYDV